jgi:hypothetical protein
MKQVEIRKQEPSIYIKSVRGGSREAAKKNKGTWPLPTPGYKTEPR